MRISREALELLVAHDFSGNVRSLAHAVETARFLAKGGEIVPADLPAKVREAATPPMPTAGDLHERLVAGGASFWDVVQTPYLRRQLSREDVLDLLTRARRESGGTWRDVARLFRIEADYKKFVNFLTHHDLRGRD